MPRLTFNKSMAEAKRGFLDRALIRGLVGEATARFFGSVGALVRKIARNSMRYRSPKAVSQRLGSERRGSYYSDPGQPPKAVRNHPYIRKFLWFDVDPATRTLVVGPARLESKTGGGIVPSLHEVGGRQVVVNPKRARPIKVGDVKPVRILGRVSRKFKGVVRVSPGRMGRVVAAGRTVPVALAHLKTGAQVARAERVAETLYGPKTYMADYPARPFMGPALDKVRPEMARLWAEAFRDTARSARRAG